MNSTKQISPWQFSMFRMLCGLYLTVHFIQLLPYANELFGSAGVLGNARLNSLHGLFPNPLASVTWPQFPVVFVSILALVSMSFTIGLHRRTSAIILWFGWACLFNRNNLIANPGIPYVGLLLVLSVLVPPGEPLVIRNRRPSDAWHMPSAIFWGAWLLLALGYSYSGIWKLFSPSWIDGTALMHLLNNPLARPGAIRDILLQFPTLLTILTWAALASEIMFLPLSLTRRGRLVAWLWMMVMHLGIILVVDFADLTFGMLMVHLFTFDPKWLPARRTRAVVLYDGECGMCNGWVKFITREQSESRFDFAPLQSNTGRNLLRMHNVGEGYRESILVFEMESTGTRMYAKSSAVLRILTGLGGFWRILAPLAIVPRSARNWLYDQVALRRHRLFPTSQMCELTH